MYSQFAKICRFCDLEPSSKSVHSPEAAWALRISTWELFFPILYRIFTEEVQLYHDFFIVTL